MIFETSCLGIFKIMQKPRNFKIPYPVVGYIQIAGIDIILFPFIFHTFMYVQRGILIFFHLQNS